MCKFCEAFKAEEHGDESGSSEACTAGLAKLKLAEDARKATRRARGLPADSNESQQQQQKQQKQQQQKQQQAASDEGVGSDEAAAEPDLGQNTHSSISSSSDCSYPEDVEVAEPALHKQKKHLQKKKQSRSKKLSRTKKLSSAVGHSASSAALEPCQENQKKQQNLALGACEGENDSKWPSGEIPLNLRLEDNTEIINLDGLLELPSEEIDFPPPRRDGEADEVLNAREGESKGGAAGRGDGDAANAASEAGRRDGDDDAGDKHKKNNKNKQKHQPTEAGENRAEDGADNASSESLFDCQPDKENEFYTLPDI